MNSGASAPAGARRAAGPLRLLLVLGPLWCVLVWAVHFDAPLCSGMGDLASYEPTKYAWNHVRYGLGVTQGRQITNLEETTPDEFVCYTSHPGVVALIAAACFRLAGAPEPAAGRVAPALATLASFVLLFLLARATAGARSASFAVALFGLFPITSVHGVNLTYQPFVLASLLLTLLLHVKGRRGSAVVALLAGGLLDFAALYPAPFMAACALFRAGPGQRSRALRFSAACVLACVCALGAHVAFLVFVVGDLTGGSTKSWYEYVAQSLGGAAAVITTSEFLASQARHLMESFTVPGILVAVLGLARFARRFALEEWALLCAGLLEVAIFRTHAHLHEFWWQYASPFFALAGGRALAGLTRERPFLGWGLLAAIAVLGARGSWHSWTARSNPEVRRTADHLIAAADPREVVFLQEPPGWSVEVFRQRLVGNSTFEKPRDFEEAIRRLGGDFLALARPIAIWLPEERLDPGLEAYIHDRFPANPSRVFAKSPRGDRTYLRIEIGSILRDASRSPFLPAACRREDELSKVTPGTTMDRLVLLAQRFLIFSLLRTGESVAVLDGVIEPAAQHRHRGLLSHTDAGSAAAGGVLYAAAWPDTPYATELARIHAGRPEEERRLELPEGGVAIRFFRLSP